MTLLAGSLQNCISDYLQNSVVHLTDALSISTYTANLERQIAKRKDFVTCTIVYWTVVTL